MDVLRCGTHPYLRIRLLGDFRVEYDGVPVDSLARPRCQALLAYLLLHREAAQSRRHLAFLLWPDSSEAQALTNLRHVMHDLLAALPNPDGGRWLVITPQTLQWDAAAPFDLDLAAFEQSAQASASAADLQTAVDLYRGDLLPACYDDWVLPERERLLQAYLSALERLVALREAEGDFGSAIELARRLLSRDPLREASYRLLMRLHVLNGDRGAALHVYHACASVLQEDLGVEPDPSTRRQHEQLMDLEALAAAQLPSFLEITAEEGAPAEPRRPVFVARERELARLDGFLSLALGGQSRIVFVTGDPGQGKTALVQGFARRAQAAHPELVVAGGSGNAYTGQGDPYVPFREILSLLSGEIEERWAAQSFSREQARRLWHTLPLTAQAVVEAGPDLVDTFVSGAPLAQRAAAYAPWPGRSDWLPRLQQLVQRKAGSPPRPDLNQNALFEQYSRVVRAIARRRPLLLTLDDLQWADAGSVGLLFHLGRSLAGGRVLVVGAYRPTDIALGRGGERHPLEPVVNEFKLQWGDIEIDLREAEGERFVSAYLDTEPNRFGEAFRATLFRQTAGLPLATVELVRAMRERGGLVRDSAGCWIEGPKLDWSTLPARVEAMIADRIVRLPEPARHALQVASAEGETFTAEIIARVVGIGEQDVVRLLSEELGRGQRLVKAEGIRYLDGQRLSIYRFCHILFQKYLYTSLDPVERSRLHDAVGNVLEALYRNQAVEIAVQLARHFEEAGLAEKAIHYLSSAGKRAVQMTANTEAVGHFTKALILLQTLPATARRDQLELPLQMRLGTAIGVAQGWAAPGVRAALERARELCRGPRNTPRLIPVLRNLCEHHIMCAEHRAAYELAQQLTALGQETNDPTSLLIAYQALGQSQAAMGDLAAARHTLERGLAHRNLDQDRSLASLYGASAQINLGVCLFILGYPNQSRAQMHEALALSEGLANPVALAWSLWGISTFHLLILREGQTALGYAERSITLCAEKGIPLWQAMASVNHGYALALLGYTSKGIAEASQALTAYRSNGTKGLQTMLLALLAEMHLMADQEDASLAAVEEAFAAVRETGERFMEAELYRLRAALRRRQGNEAEAEADLGRALTVACKQQARWWELRATLSLCRSWRSQGRYDEARQLLAEIYGWFTEGFDTLDLQEAKVLLEELGREALRKP